GGGGRGPPRRRQATGPDRRRQVPRQGRVLLRAEVRETGGERQAAAARAHRRQGPDSRLGLGAPRRRPLVRLQRAALPRQLEAAGVPAPGGAGRAVVAEAAGPQGRPRGRGGGGGLVKARGFAGGGAGGGGFERPGSPPAGFFSAARGGAAAGV